MKSIYYLLILVIFFGGFCCLHSQSVSFGWAKSLSGYNGGETGPTDIATDNSGNVYTFGVFVNTADFDPGPSTFTLNSLGWGPYITKLDANGNLIWARHFRNPFLLNNSPFSGTIDVDTQGNVYCCGGFRDYVDFDPGPGTYTLNPMLGRVYVCKLDANGNFLWCRQFADSMSTVSRVKVDSNGDVVFVGVFRMLSNDFDPGPATYSLTPAGMADIFVCKISASGNLIWVKSVGGSQDDSPSDFTLNNQNQIITTGIFNSAIADFDPSANSYTLTNQNGGLFVSTIASTGAFVNAWQFGNLNTYGQRISIDSGGDLIVGGTYSGVTDMDPGPGVLTYTSVGNNNFFIGKYTQLSGLVWTRQFGLGSTQRFIDMTLDVSGNVFYGGYIAGLVDFDPGPGTFTMSPGSPNSLDSYVSKISSSGNFLWAKQVKGPTHDYVQCLTVDNSGIVYSSGRFTGNSDFDPGPGTFTMATLDQDAFIQKLVPCNLPSPPVVTSSTLASCGAAAFSFSASPTYSITWRNSLMSNSYLTNSAVYSTSLLSIGNYSFYAAISNTCAESFPPAIVQVSVFPFPNISVTASKDTFCYGENVILTPSGGINYVMSNAFYTSTILVTPLTNTIYTIVGGDVNGCSSTTSISLTADLCTGISENEKVNALKVWPNPAKEKIFISADNLKYIEIYNSVGQLLFSQRTEDTTSTIDLPYPAGLYYVRLKQESGNFTERKIVIE